MSWSDLDNWQKALYVLRFLGATAHFFTVGLLLGGLYYLILLGRVPPGFPFLGPEGCIQITLVVVLMTYSADRLLAHRYHQNSTGAETVRSNFGDVHLILILFAFLEYWNRDLGFGKVAAIVVFAAPTLYFSLLLIEQLARDNRNQILRRRRALHSNRWEWGLTPAAFYFAAALTFGLLLWLSLAMAARTEMEPSSSPLAQSSEAAVSMGRP